MNVAFIAEKLGGEYEKIGGARQSLMENMVIPKSELRKELGDQLCITANNSERCFVSFLSLSLLSFHKTARRAPSNSIGWKRLKILQHTKYLHGRFSQKYVPESLPS
jgi:hypothetical protein